MAWFRDRSLTKDRKDQPRDHWKCDQQPVDAQRDLPRQMKLDQPKDDKNCQTNIGQGDIFDVDAAPDPSIRINLLFFVWGFQHSSVINGHKSLTFSISGRYTVSANRIAPTPKGKKCVHSSPE
jgi:hypothetical protein